MDVQEAGVLLANAGTFAQADTERVEKAVVQHFFRVFVKTMRRAPVSPHGLFKLVLL